MIPPTVAHNVLNIQAKTITVGLSLLYIILSDIIVVGIIVRPLVFITKKVIIDLVAVFFLSFSFCIDSIAFIPNGVAALPSPNILDIILPVFNNKIQKDIANIQNEEKTFLHHNTHLLPL